MEIVFGHIQKLTPPFRTLKGDYMNNKTFYYARVSSKEQNLDRQLSAFYSLGATDRDIITDKESGKNLNRNGYQALKNTLLRSGDTLVIKRRI